MPITCSAYVPKSTLCLDLSDVRKTILAAAKRAAKTETHTKYDVALPVGKHTLKEPFRLSAKENPELKFLDITIRSEKPGMAEVNSLVRLDGKKFVKAAGKDYFTYDFMKEEGKIPLFRDLFLNFHHISASRSRSFSNIEPVTAEENKGTYAREGLWIPMDIAKQLASAPLGATEIIMYIEWDFAIFHVVGVDLTKTRTENGETYALARIKEGELAYVFSRISSFLWTRCREMYIRNAPAFLTTNTYAYDYTNGILYLDPENPEYTQYHAIEYPACEVLFELDGVENVAIEDITFYGASSKYACSDLYFSGQANTLPGYGGVRSGRVQTAAVLGRDVRNITLSGCYFRDLGANAVQIVDYSVGVTVKNSFFSNIGMCGVSIGNPSWEWFDPKNRTFAARIENCRFRHIAYEYPSAPCIYIGQVDGLKILRNTVEDCGYSAISVGWNWSPQSWELGERVNIRDAEIAYNYFENFMQLLRDGGAIYVLGSNCNHESISEHFNFMHDNFAIADNDRKTFLGKYGYYCDGASSNWKVSHSVMFNIPIFPIFSQPHPEALSYHNRFEDIYANTLPNPATSVAPRDIVRENYVYEDISPEEYLAKYPEAKRIRDAAGSSLSF